MEFVTRASDLIWNAPVLAALLACSLYICVRWRWPQRYIPDGIKNTFGVAYKSLCVNLAAVLGVGNIIGMALAVAAGGPGAVLWCWLAGYLAIGVQYAMCRMSLRYREKGRDGRYRGGPMYAMRFMGMKKSAVAYASSVVIGGLISGAATSSNAVAMTVGNHWASVALAAVSAVVIYSGAHRVKEVCAYAVPVMCVLYISSCIGIIWMCRAAFPAAVISIVREAFTPRALSCGAVYGMYRAARYGVSRSIFSNEASVGTASIAAAEDKTGGHTCAAVQATGVVWDTLVTAALTGITLVTYSTAYGWDLSDAAGLTSRAFALIPRIGKYLLPISVTLLSFSTVLGWYYIALRAFEYLFPGKNPALLRAAWIFSAATGGVFSAAGLWAVGDIVTAVNSALAMTVLVKWTAVGLHVRKRPRNRNVYRIFISKDA